MTDLGWLIVSISYGIGWLGLAHWLFATHKAKPHQWRDQLYRFKIAFGYAVLALFWPLGIVYLIIRGKAVPEQ